MTNSAKAAQQIVTPRALTALSIPLIILLVSFLPALPHGSYGTHDFIEYWTAFQIAQGGGEPYNPQQVLAAEQAAGADYTVPLMMWNPPWLLSIMAPVLAHDFLLSTKIWLATNLILYAIALFMLWQLYQSSKSPSALALVSLLSFFPFWICLYYGQIGILLGFAVSLFLWSLNRNNEYTAGAALAMLSVKPHLFYLFAVLFVWWVVKEKRFKVLYGLIIASFVLVAATQLILPGTLEAWVSAMRSPPRIDGLVRPAEWQVATLVGLVRNLVGGSEQYPAWPMFTIPGVVALATLFYVIRRQPSIDWKKTLPPLLCLSLATSPFGWSFDQAALLLMPVSLIACTQLSGTAIAVAIINISAILQWLYLADHHGAFYWYPVALLTLWGLTKSQRFRFGVDA